MVDWLILFVLSLALCVLAFAAYLLIGIETSSAGAFAVGNFVGCIICGGYIVWKG